ncbi:unnamed protein product [Brassica napus]|uniref:(rape) hypothetical protein n=1 Tax=Brassica napus TaxID=3708 RepID=A0A816WQU0_BRANA|nr:unnamed protein product [Brassica napus]
MLKMYLMASFLGDSSLTLLPMCSLPLCLLMKQQKWLLHTVIPQSGSVKTKLALIGKGLTFDSGGYNINAGTGSPIELMKFDMGGSAAVLGAAKAIGKIKRPGVEVHFIVAAFENMISGTGMRDLMMSSQPQTERPLRYHMIYVFRCETFAVYPMAMLTVGNGIFRSTTQMLKVV